MSLLRQDVENAYGLINTDIGANNYIRYSKVFPFTTENICGYYNTTELDVKGKDILTVCSSGDQAFNAVLKGAKRVDTFDINKFTMYYMRLKEAGIRELSFEDFISFFVINAHYKNNENVFRYDIYKKIERSLESDIKAFWNSLYDFYLNDGIKLRRSDFFDHNQPDFSTNLKCNEYLDEYNYKDLQKKMANHEIGFVQSDIFDLIDNLDRDSLYDLMFLSNISNFLISDNEQEMLHKFRELIFDLSFHLNDEGKIAAAYFFYTSYEKIKRSSLFKALIPDVHPMLIKSYYGYDDDFSADGIVVYTKKKTINFHLM